MSTIQDAALGCMLPGFEGVEAPDWIRRRAAEGLGGAVIFARNVRTRDQLRRLVDSLHGERPDLVVAIDEEGGEVTRLEAGTGSSSPGNLALGRVDDVDLTTAVAASIGSALAVVSVDLNLAPVADVNTDPLNPIIGARSFGSDASLVARHTAAWVRGLQGAGVAACAKHFPGHGDTAVDSHLDLPVAGEDPRVRALEPFRAAIAAGVRAVMSAHIVAPALDSVPATLSRRIMTDLLREELGFEGAAITDGLEMRALSAGRGVGEVAVLALAAGCDALCVGGGLAGEDVVDEIVAAIVSAVRDRRLSDERVSEAASRVRRVKIDSAALQAARRALCAEGDIHVDADAEVVQLPSPPSIAAGDVPWGVSDALRARGVRIKEGGARLVIVVRDLHRQPGNQATVDAMLAARPDGIVVEMGVPLHRPRAARNYLATFGSALVCARAAAELMTSKRGR